MWLIEEAPGQTVAEVKAQEHSYLRLREQLTDRYGRLADLVTATYFGLDVDVDATRWPALVAAATNGAAGGGEIADADAAEFARLLDEAGKIARERRFFHLGVGVSRGILRSDGTGTRPARGF